MNENISVNDGKGLYDNEGICDSLASDLNELIRNAVAGHFIKCSAIVYNMIQKLNNLKKGIRTELESKDEIIEQLKSMNNALVEEKTGLPVKE